LRSSLLVKKESSSSPESLPMAYARPPCKIQSDFEGVANTGANYGVKTEVINLEEEDFKPR
jgi:Fanconi anemia group J protein